VATIYEVSKLAGVSLATVSRVMNNSGRVSDKTREKVLRAMRELDYEPNAIAQSLASNRSNCVGVLVSELHGPFYGAMLSGIESELRQAGKFAIFAAGHSDEQKEKEGIRFLGSRNCDALILHVEALPNSYFLERRDEMLPFVLLNRTGPGLEENCICLDNELGGYLATRSLLEFGHRRIGYISGPLSWGDAQDRIKGHKRALAEFRVKFEQDLLVEGDYTEFGGGRATKDLLDRGEDMTAIVCANDEMAAGALHVIRKRGLNVPDDISVVGFDNVSWARYLHPKLSTVNFPISEMSHVAARAVLSTVYGQDTGRIQHLFEPRFIQRGSSGPVPIPD
jgi:LacI family transcriptional regulator